jgi:tRNA pseudouridine38-40 synthase
MRIVAGIEYNGNKFHGWQSQQDVTTIQTTLEAALSKVADEPIKIFCAGRTDRGVHATNQVIHFDTTVNRKLIAWVFGTNSYLPPSISIQWAQVIDDHFHARFSALSRRYQYIIYNYHVRSALFYAQSTWVTEQLALNQMSTAAHYLVGEHDFSSFRSAQCQSKTAFRHIHTIEVKRVQDLVVIDIVANSFLHHMVRNIVGVLLEIGEGEKSPEWCQEVLLAKDRKLAAKTAPPQGLYLTGVRYADAYNLPCDFKSPLMVRGN